MPKILIKRMRPAPHLELPQYASAGSAGMDLRASVAEGGLSIWPGECKMIPTGIAIDMSAHPGLCALIFARSGLATKARLSLANGVGVIDNDYQGEIHVALQNNDQQMVSINPGVRIAQLVFFTPTIGVEWEETEEFEPTDRGAGGFGSTGVD